MELYNSRTLENGIGNADACFPKKGKHQKLKRGGGGWRDLGTPLLCEEGVGGKMV